MIPRASLLYPQECGQTRSQNNHMILLGSNLINIPVLSLQTGGAIANTVRAIIDPAKLNIIAYEVKGPLINTPAKASAYIRVADIRELTDMGAIVDSIDEIVYSGDVIALDTVEKLRFGLLGIKVTNEQRKKLGKVIDYTVDMNSQYIQQLTVKRPLVASVTDTELLIHRTQIIEINNNSIVVHSAAKAPEPERTEVMGSYINPFRKSEPAVDTIEARN